MLEVPKKNAGLEALKANAAPEEKDILASKMPSRTPQPVDTHQAIKIPTSSSAHSQPLIYKKETIEAVKKTLQEQGKKPSEKLPSAQEESFFGGGMGISRKDFKYKLMRSTEAWQAAKQSGLGGLSPIERSKLIKDIPKTYGTNVSGSDIDRSVRKLNQQLRSATDPKQHTQLRKEIKFFKKIKGM